MKKLQSGTIKEILPSSDGTSAVLVIEREDGTRVLKLAAEVKPVK